ncbi:MAG TPA: HGxxPAAW family protein [Kineosporiaceae bacterium]|nr:HGxxPAAW family protein [Kineosporiaceae bacterium]
MTDSQQVRGRHAQAPAAARAAGPASAPAPGVGAPAGAPDAGPAPDGGQVPAHGAEPAAPPHDAHGQSVASWTAVSVIMLGTLIMAVAVVVTNWWVFAVGAVVIVLGAVSGRVLSAMGFGVSGRPAH